MCFSFEVSIGTFIFSWSICLYLLSKNLNSQQINNVIFLMIFSSMQFVDAILWYINLKKNNINYIITSIIIPFILSLQIFYNLFVINKIRNSLVYLFVMFYIILNFSQWGSYTTKSTNMFNSPTWGGKEFSMLSMIIFFMLIMYGRIGFSGEKLHHLIIGILTLSAVSAFTGGVGSIWCSLANILAVYYYFKYQ